MSDTSSSQGSNQANCQPVGKGEYVAEPGDCVESVAFAHGFFWETLWNDPQNADVKKARKDPNVLLPGDRLHIPEKRIKEESGSTEQRHRFKLKGVPAQLRLKFCKDGEPRKNVPYTLWIDGRAIKGSTDGEGMVIQPLMPGAGDVSLRLGDDPQDYVLKVGHLDPRDSVSGLQFRLRNLGYYSGEDESDLGPQTKAALRQFQVDNGLDATGEPNQQTLDKLEAAHGS